MQREMSSRNVVSRKSNSSLAYEERQLLRIWRMYDGGGRRALRTRLLLPPRIVLGNAAAVLRCQARRFYGIVVHVQWERVRDVE